MNLTESWPRSGTTAELPQLNSAFGMASLVKEVDIIGANVTGDKQMTLHLRYDGNESAPPIIIQARIASIQPIFNHVKASSSEYFLFINKVRCKGLPYREFSRIIYWQLQQFLNPELWYNCDQCCRDRDFFFVSLL